VARSTRTRSWGLPDPAPVQGFEAEVGVAFGAAYRVLSNRVSLFANPIASLTKLSLQERLSEIGTTTDKPSHA
jgi:hypothetical protein